MPDGRGDILVFPYFDHEDVEVNFKFRAEPKKFWQVEGGRKTFWNAQVLDDPQLANGINPLIITEGEFDGVVAVECGFPHTVSVPDGAPPADGKQADLEEDQNGGKFEFVWNNRDRLKPIKRFILAVDNDPPGQKLAAELVRRLGAVRCSFVTYPPGCKDLNDVLLKLGPEVVAAVLNEAKPYPVKGLYRFSDYPSVPDLQVFSTGWPLLDEYFKVFPGEFVVVTGVPSHGKSQWVLNLAVNLSRLHDWRIAIFSPEMPTVPQLRNVLHRIVAGGERKSPEVDGFLNDRFVIIDADPETKGDEPLTVGWIIEKATDAVMRDGVRVLIVDPWNEVEHAKEKGEQMTDYIGRSIRDMKRFGKRYGVAVFVIAHPTKDVYDRGKPRPVTLYDIEGSAHWFNKCDHGIVIQRNVDTNQTKINVAKSRFESAGTRGSVEMKFDRSSGRFKPLDEGEYIEPFT